MSDKVFAEGLFYDPPRDGAPDFVIGGLTVSVDRFTDWLAAQPKSDKGYVKIDIKRGRTGKIYAELNTFQPKKQAAPQPQGFELNDSLDDLSDDIPF